MKHIETIEEFDNAIKDGKVVVDFFATWCGPCQLLSPIIEKVSEEHKDITFIKVDTDDFYELAKRYGIMTIPTLIVFENGKEIKKNIGLLSKSELEDFIK